MRARAKHSEGFPIWVEGEYITKPPIRPKDGAERPEGHYIDKGGYPGANVYAVDMNTFCKAAGATDKNGTEIYDNDFLIWESEEEIAYYLIQDRQAVDIVTGEIFTLQELAGQEIKVIGNRIDCEEFIEGINHAAEQGGEIPYIPLINVQISALPYFKLECEKCRNKTLSLIFKAHCSCGGWYKIDYATKVYRKKEKEKALP